MPRFNTPQSKRPAPKMSTPVPNIKEPKCLVCQSAHRNLIDQMLVAGLTFSEIERQMSQLDPRIKRRSVSNHKDLHLGYEEAAIRHVIEQEAKATQQNFEEGVGKLVTKNVYLEVALQKAYNVLSDESVVVEPKDAVKIIELLQKREEQTYGVAIDEIRVQFQAFMRAVKEIVPTSYWEDVVARTEKLLKHESFELAAVEVKVADAEVIS